MTALLDFFRNLFMQGELKEYRVCVRAQQKAGYVPSGTLESSPARFGCLLPNQWWVDSTNQCTVPSGTIESNDSQLLRRSRFSHRTL
jgi:hypothetical protein